MRFLKRFKSDARGVTALEYALIMGLISVFLITGMSAIGPKIARVFGVIGTAMDGS